MKIGPLDTQHKIMIVAEIGNNHEGDKGRARKMIHEAAAAGVDAIKFQTIVPESLVSADQTQRLEMFRKFQLNREDHEMLSEEAMKAGVVFLTTPFDLDAVDWLDSLVPAYKVASGDNDFWPLLNRLSQTGKPVIVSLGLRGPQHASQLIDFFKNAWRRNGVKGGKLALLHCVAAYPTPDETAGLGVLHEMRNLGVTVGYSDHTLGTKAAELAAAAGARIIEKHFTLDKAQSDFRDHQLSADPGDMRELVAAVRLVERFLGKDDGVSADEDNKVPASRSIAAARDLHADAVLNWDDLTWVRPGSGLRPGEEDQVVGRKVKQAIQAGCLILPEHLS